MKYFVFMVISIFFSGCSMFKVQEPILHPLECSQNIYSIKSAQCLSDEKFIQNIEPYQVIFFGDHHGSKKLHESISHMIRLLSQKGYKIHLANEWFTPAKNNILDEYSTGAIDDKEFIEKIKWDTKSRFTFDIFMPIYHAIRETKGKLYGINLSKKERNLISDEDTKSMSRDEILFFKNLDTNITAHKTLYAPFFSDCHKPKKNESNKECIERMYRVQIAWDTKMAKESLLLVKNILKSPKDKLIVFAGASHVAYGLGINLHFARESNIPFVTIVPQSKTQKSVQHVEADFIYMYEEDKQAKEIEAKLLKDLKHKNRSK